MTKYKCDICNYSTYQKGHYNKHLSTSKHKKNVSNNPQIIHQKPQIIPIESTNNNLITQTVQKSAHLYECNGCGNSFKQMCHLSRHIKVCPKLFDIKIVHEEKINCVKKEYDTKNEQQRVDYELKIKNIIMEYELKLKNTENLLKNSEIEKESFKETIKLMKKYEGKIQNEIKDTKLLLTKENDYKQDLLKESGSIIKTTTNALNYVKLHFKKAPPLKMLEDFSFLVPDDNDKKFCADMVSKYMSGELCNHIGEIIVKQCRTDDPNHQSIWNSDCSRLTYLVRKLINDKVEWVTDNKGKGVKENIVNPIVNYIKEQINQYLKTQYKELDAYIAEIAKYNVMSKEDQKMAYDINYCNLRKRDHLMDLTKNGQELVREIERNVLSDKIVRYMAPYFHINGKGEIKYITKEDEIIEEDDKNINEYKTIKEDKIIDNNTKIMKTDSDEEYDDDDKFIASKIDFVKPILKK